MTWINRWRAKVPPVVGTIGRILLAAVILYSGFTALFRVR